MSSSGWGALSTERLPLLVKVARMYHEQHIRQPEIAERLHISQSRVSRLLKEAVESGLVRTIVITPPGLHSELEDEVRTRYGLADVVIAGDETGDQDAVLAALASAGATYLEATLNAKDDIGVSSWSSTLLAVVDAMTPSRIRIANSAVQLLGGVGDPSVQVKATHLTDRLARVTGAEACYFPAPGIVARAAVRDAMLEDPYVSEVASAWDSLSVAIVGIGSLHPSPLLKSSGNAISDADQAALRELGAVGDVCLRFFDAAGRPVPSELDDRVIGISGAQLHAIPRTVGIAGGERKFEAIRAAARGSWIDVLITDVRTARRLVQEEADAPHRPCQ